MAESWFDLYAKGLSTILDSGKETMDAGWQQFSDEQKKVDDIPDTSPTMDFDWGFRPDIFWGSAWFDYAIANGILCKDADKQPCTKYVSPCSPIGTGPECTKTSPTKSATRDTKSECLAEVKRNCEQAHTKCLNTCKDEYKKLNKFYHQPLITKTKKTAVTNSFVNCYAVRYWVNFPVVAPDTQTLIFQSQSNPPVLPLSGASLWTYVDVLAGIGPGGAVGTQNIPNATAVSLNNSFGSFQGCKIPAVSYDEETAYMLACWDGTEKGDGSSDAVDPADTASKWFECRVDCFADIFGDPGRCSSSHCGCNSMKCDVNCPEGYCDFDGSDSAGTDTTDGGSTFDPDAQRFTKKSLKTQSQYGWPIEYVYTRHFMNGNIVYFSPLRPVTSTFIEQVIDGATGTVYPVERTRIDNFVDFFVALCMPADAVQRIWMDDELIYDLSESTTATGQERLSITFYNGSEGQPLDATMAAQDGSEFTPAYRGLAGVLFKDFNLSFLKAAAIPQFRFEVVKVIDATTPQPPSAVMADVDDSELFHFDPNANRLFVRTSGGDVRIIDTLDFSIIRDVTLTGSDDDTFMVTPLHFILAQTGAVANSRPTALFDPVWGDKVTEFGASGVGTSHAIGNLADVTGGAFGVHRYVDDTGIARHMLIASSTDGDIYFYPVNEVQGTIGEAIASYDNVMGGHADYISAHTVTLPHSLYPSVEVITSSIYAFRALNSGGNAILVKGFPMNSADTSLALVPDEGVATYNLADSVFAGASDVVILGVYPDTEDDSFIIFASYTGGTLFKIVKWSPADGIVWNTTHTSLPDWNCRELASRGPSERIVFAAPDGNFYSVDRTSGEVATGGNLDVTIHATLQSQFYDTTRDDLVYFASDDTFVRLGGNRVITVDQNLGDIVKDICMHAGMEANLIDTSDLESQAVVGWRSAANATPAAMILELGATYPFRRFEDHRLTFVLQANTTMTVIDTDDIRTGPKVQLRAGRFDINSAIVKYHDNETDGAPWEQQFTLPSEFPVNKQPAQISLNALLDADYARQLAELLVVMAIENAKNTEIYLPPKYFAQTPTESVRLGVGGPKYRIVGQELGADQTIRLILAADDAGKYTDLAGLSGVESFFEATDPAIGTAMPAPLLFNNRPVAPYSDTGDHQLQVALDNLTGTGPSAAFGNYESELEPGELVRQWSLDNTLAWGRVTQTPTALSGNIPFTTQLDGEVVIKFYSTEFASRLSSATMEQVLANPLLNLLRVGGELIQFIDVVVVGAEATCSGLLRARYCTDDAMDHVINEPAYFYEADTLQHIGFDIDEHVGAKMATLTSSNLTARQRKNDMVFGVNRPPAPSTIKRQDFAPDVLSESATYPDSQDIVMTWETRDPSREEFEDDLNVIPSTTDALIYFLRGNYDAEDFAAALLTPEDTSYIMWRGETDQGVVNAYEAFTGEYTPDVDRGFVWYAIEQEGVAFDHNTDFFCVVTILAPESHPDQSLPCVRCFNHDVDYSVVPIPGLETING